MENPGVLVIEIYTYTGVPWSTEYIFIKNYLCRSSPYCVCFLNTKNFTVRCDVASAIVYYCKSSSKFAVAMNQYARSLTHHLSQHRKLSRSWRCLVNLNLVLHTDLYSQIDYAWGNRLALLSYKWSLLIDATAWLSTLGGGHSSLGENSELHAHKAGNLSVKQFKLALELGDKGLEYRCRLYFALSLMQRGQLAKSKLLIRWIYNEAKNRLQDERLLVMCQGVWSKLRYHYTLMKQQNTITSNCSSTCNPLKNQSPNR